MSSTSSEFRKLGGVPFVLFSMAGIIVNNIQDLSIVCSRTEYNHEDVCHRCGNPVNCFNGHTSHTGGAPICPMPLTLKEIAHGANLKDAIKFKISRYRVNELQPAILFNYKKDVYLFSIQKDSNEKFSYRYLARMDKPVCSIKEAYEQMMPREARHALAEGFEVQRQGDIYFIETPYSTKQLPGKVKHNFPIFGTWHFATEAKCSDNLIFVRKTIRHKAMCRSQRVVNLGGDRWWKAVKSPLKSWKN